MEAEVSALKCISPVVTYHGLHMLDSLLIKIFDIGNRFIFFKLKKKKSVGILEELCGNMGIMQKDRCM